MGCHGGFNLDEATRRSWYDPDAILSELQAGMVFADIGCGEGFFSLLAAKQVGENGKVYAVDIDPKAIDRLRQKAQKEGITNVVAKAASAEETVFCEACVDWVFYSMDLHDFEDQTKVLLNARKMIKPTGRLVDLDWKKQQMPFGPPVQIRFGEEKVQGLLKRAGFSVESIKDAGLYHYLIVAKPAP